MSALGQKQTCAPHVRFTPNSDRESGLRQTVMVGTELRTSLSRDIYQTWPHRADWWRYAGVIFETKGYELKYDCRPPKQKRNSGI
jgi:hypothetical protein